MKDLSSVQKVLLNMLKEFHYFCERNDLTYYSLGGTTLGALRHHGFIPWDDDVDLALPRRDYNRLCYLLKNSRIHDKYVLETCYSCNNYMYPYAKLYDTSTTLIENTRFHLKRGVYLDIFPLDGIADSSELVEKNYHYIEKKLNLLGLRTIQIRRDRAFYKNIVLFLAQIIPERVFSTNKLAQDIDRLCQKYSFEHSEWGGNLVGAWRIKEIMPLDIFGKPRLVQFENIEIYVQEYAEEYLKRQYGNWEQLPPKDKQISHHDYKLQLDRGYLDN